MARGRKEINFLSDKNKKLLDEFMNHIETKYHSKCTIKSFKFSIKKILSKIDKDIEKLKINELNEIFKEVEKTSAEIYKSKFRQFLKYYGLNELANKIQFNPKVLREQKKGLESVLTKEEIKTYIETPLYIRDKALCETYIVSGARLNEIRNLNVRDVEIEEATIWINIRVSKTKIRRIPIVAIEDNPVAIYPKNLINFIQSHPFKNQKDNPLFYSTSPNNYKGRLSAERIYQIITKTAKEAKIEHKITPHILRHTCASYDGYALSEQLLCQKFGWNVGSQMARRYCHQNDDMLNSYLLKKAGITEEQVKQESICPNCGESNNINSDRCVRCNYILNKKLMFEELEKRKNIEDRVKRLEEILTHFVKSDENNISTIEKLQEENEKLENELFLKEAETGLGKENFERLKVILQNIER